MAQTALCLTTEAAVLSPLMPEHASTAGRVQTLESWWALMAGLTLTLTQSRRVRTWGCRVRVLKFALSMS